MKISYGKGINLASQYLASSLSVYSNGHKSKLDNKLKFFSFQVACVVYLAQITEKR